MYYILDQSKNWSQSSCWISFSNKGLQTWPSLGGDRWRNWWSDTATTTATETIHYHRQHWIWGPAFEWWLWRKCRWRWWWQSKIYFEVGIFFKVRLPRIRYWSIFRYWKAKFPVFWHSPEHTGTPFFYEKITVILIFCALISPPPSTCKSQLTR